MIEVWQLAFRHEDAALEECDFSLDELSRDELQNRANTQNFKQTPATQKLSFGQNPHEILTATHKSVIKFSHCIGHGVGTLDFSRKIAAFSEAEWAGFLDKASEWVRAKFGNVNRYFEIEVSVQQAQTAAAQMPPSPLRKILQELKEGYLTIRKSSFC